MGSLLAASLLNKAFAFSFRLQNMLSVLIGAGSFLLCGSLASAQEDDRPSLSRLINTGQIEEAQIILEAGSPSDADRLFFAGRVLKAQGNLPEAINVFRQVLQTDPDYINARRELAHTLLLNRDYGSAGYHFEALLRADDNDQMRDGYRRFLNIIDQNKPIGFSGYFSVLPSTNVNRGTANTVFDTTLGQFVIDPGSRAESGLGAKLGVSGYFRHPTGPTSRVALSWSLSGTRYEQEEYNSAVGSVALSYEQITGSGSWLLSPYYRMTRRQDDTDNNARGLRFGLINDLGNKVQLSFALSHEYRDFVIQDYQDGSFTSGSVSLNYQVSPSVAVSGGLGFERSSPQAEHLQYDATKILFGLSKSWEGGLQTSFGFEYGQRDFVGVFPLTTSARDDDFYQLSFSVQNSRINIQGFTPQLSCSYSRNRSNVAFYDYDATECQATISRNF